MRWGTYSVFFGLSMIKFLFTPFGGPAAKLTFLETYIVCVVGAIVSAVVFYFSSEYFLKRAAKKRHLLMEESRRTGVPIQRKKNFTRANKFIVRLKRRIGIVGISMYAPLFLSVPLGSIITAKFYGKDKRTFPLICLGMCVNGAITTGIAYGFADLF